MKVFVTDGNYTYQSSVCTNTQHMQSHNPEISLIHIHTYNIYIFTIFVAVVPSFKTEKTGEWWIVSVNYKLKM